MIQSVVICRHGKLGYSASLRFDDKNLDVDISANDKRSLNRTIDYLVRKAGKSSDRTNDRRGEASGN